jgi:flagellar motor protein MotB
MKESATPGFLSHAFTDLMASLAVIFILLSVVFIHNASKKRENDKEMIKDRLAEILEKNKLPIRQDPNDASVLMVQVGEDLLKFPVNSATLSGGGAKFLDEFAPGLAAQLCSEPVRSRIDAVVIEGHTDRSGESNVEGTRRNIRLSQTRSFAVLDRALQAVQAQPDMSECLLKLASATGRGSRVPVEVDGKYDADRSRRVEIKIRLKSADQAGLLKGLRPSGSG